MHQLKLNTIKVCLLSASILFTYINACAQQPTYTVDSEFDTGDLFRARSGVMEIIPVEDNRILVGGGFHSIYFNPSFNSMGMIYEDGSIDDDWFIWDSGIGISKIIVQNDGYVFPYIQGISKMTLNGNFWPAENSEYWCEYMQGLNESPYNVQSVWTIYEQDDGKILLGGAIASDTLQPFLYRSLLRVYADGSHDDTFPPIECQPNSSNSRITQIQQTSDDYWYVSGNFEAINGHETHHIARLSPSFEIDTNFVSPFLYDGLNTLHHPTVRKVDSQDRLWVSSQKMRLTEAPEDTIQLIRLMGDGSVDAGFSPRYLESNYPEDWGQWSRIPYVAGIVELESHPGNYLLYGQYNVFDGNTQNCITVVDDAGEIQNSFFQGQGATHLNYTTLGTGAGDNRPTIREVFELENGDLLVGGSFSDFMGTSHYNMIKLNLGVLTSDGVSEMDRKFKLYPNPSSTFVNLVFEGLLSGQISVINLIGQVVETHQMFGSTLRLNTSELTKGVYFVSLETSEGIAIKKMVVN